MTYSIVARDPETGSLGVAVQTHQPSVGALCPFAEPDVGAVATQSIVEPEYGPRGLEAMRGGDSATDALPQITPIVLQQSELRADAAREMGRPALVAPFALDLTKVDGNRQLRRLAPPCRRAA